MSALLRTSPVLLGSGFGALLVACGAAPDDPWGTDAANIGQAQIALTSVPSGVKCIQISAAGAETVTEDFSVTAATSTETLEMGRLPLGETSFSGAAYDISCTDAALATTQPTWVSDVVDLTLRAGVTSEVALTFRPNEPVSVSANFIQGVQSISGRYRTFYAVMADGSVKQWGYNPATNSNVTTPTTVSGLDHVVQVAAGGDFACARKTNGTIWCWGFASVGQLGPWALPGRYADAFEVPLPGAATDVAAGEYFACAVVGGTVYCWGYNDNHQVSADSLTYSSNPVMRHSATVRVYAGLSHACSVDYTGVAHCWGNNSAGQIGVARTSMTYLESVSAPVRLGDVTGTVSMALGAYHSCALRGDGLVKCWGLSGSAISSSPADGGISDAVSIAAGDYHTCAVRADGTLACWGSLSSDGSGIERVGSPTNVPGLTDIVDIAGAEYAACAITSDLGVSCWGRNDSGQLGDGTRIAHYRPAPVGLE